MAASTFALAMLSLDARPRPRTTDAATSESTSEPRRTSTSNEATTRSSRSARRPTSHFNYFQTTCEPASASNPPTYAQTMRFQPSLPRGMGREALPAYQCTVEATARVLLKLESADPLRPVADEGEWKEVFAVLRGTLLSFRKVTKDGQAGKLLRSYTMQHAEAGLATDSQHATLTPASRLAYAIPTAMRQRVWSKDPHLFHVVPHTLLRLRLETDQILLSHADETLMVSLLSSLAAAIDISIPIDERSIPRQSTVPRRRRRQQRTTQSSSENLTDPALLAEQERILREMYPGFAGETSARDQNTTARPEDELDLSVMQEEASATEATESGNTTTPVRPPNERQTTASTLDSTFSTDMVYATPSTNFSTEGKWQPPHTRSASQVQRYIRRCLPSLPADAPRASDVLIHEGRRVKVNWRMEVLEDWTLEPPSYKAHNFGPEVGAVSSGLTRTPSHASSSSAAMSLASQSLPLSSQLTLASGTAEEITPLRNISTMMTNLELAKCTTTTSTTTTSDKPARKTRSPRLMDPDLHNHGIAFCF